MAKFSKKLEQAKRSQAARSRKARDAKHDLIRRATLTATAYTVGKGAEVLQSLPTFFGLPRTATLAVVGAGVSMFTSGTVSAAAEGVLDAGLALTAFQLGTGQTVAGVVGRRHAPYTGDAPIRDVVGARALEQEIEAALAEVRGLPRLDEAVLY